MKIISKETLKPLPKGTDPDNRTLVSVMLKKYAPIPKKITLPGSL
jgi:hypothetical protein